MAASDGTPIQAVTLPVDLLHLLAQQLSDREDFPTLYNCVASSKHFANSGAISALYRISDRCLINSGASDNLPLAEQELNVQKWSILWRTLILSALGKTLFPYCRHIRSLDLLDLGYLLEDDKFRGSIARHFFANDLSRFHFTINTPAKTRVASRLDRTKIVTAIGDEITQHAPLLETLSEPVLLDVLSTALLTWAPRLPHLCRLKLFDGKAFADEKFRNLLHAHCPNLEALTVCRSSHPDTDHALATFIGGMPENKLTSLEVIGDVGIAAETYLALASHAESLTSLKLRLGDEGILALGLLQSCTAIKTLAIGSDRGYAVDLKATQNDVFLEIVEWLKACTNLKDLDIHNILSATDIVEPALYSNTIQLDELSINSSREEFSYISKDHGDFHRSLRTQSNLRRLLLRGDPDPPSRDDIEVLVDSLCSLTELRELNLIRISDWFNDENISLLGQCMPKLENLYVGGFGCSDRALTGIADLGNLRFLTFSTLSRFTFKGIVNFIDRLGPGNTGIVISVESADSDYAITDQEVEDLRKMVQDKLDGRFEYQFFRGTPAWAVITL